MNLCIAANSSNLPAALQVRSVRGVGACWKGRLQGTGPLPLGQGPAGRAQSDPRSSACPHRSYLLCPPSALPILAYSCQEASLKLSCGKSDVFSQITDKAEVAAFLDLSLPARGAKGCKSCLTEKCHF